MELRGEERRRSLFLFVCVKRISTQKRRRVVATRKRKRKRIREVIGCCLDIRFVRRRILLEKVDEKWTKGETEEIFFRAYCPKKESIFLPEK